MLTSSANMWKNVWASSTTLASLWSGTPTPRRFNSMRMRKRAMCFSLISIEDAARQMLDHFVAEAVFDTRLALVVVPGCEDIGGFFHDPRKVAGGVFVVSPFDARHRQAPKGNSG